MENRGLFDYRKGRDGYKREKLKTFSFRAGKDAYFVIHYENNVDVIAWFIAMFLLS